MTAWTFDKFMYFLEYETNLKIQIEYISGPRKKLKIEDSSSKEIDDSVIFPEIEINSDEQAIEQLKVLFDICKERLQVYGTVEELFEYFKRIDRIEHGKANFLPSQNRVPFTYPKYTDVSGNITCVSNLDVIKYIQSELVEKLHDFSNFFDSTGSCKSSFPLYIWSIARLRSLSTYYKMITDDSWKSVYQKLFYLCDIRNFEYVEEDRDIEALYKSMMVFKMIGSNVNDLGHDLSMLKNPNMKKIYAVLTYFHKAINPILNEPMLYETPQRAASDYKPIIRRFKGAGCEFYGALDVMAAFPKENIIQKKEQGGKHLTIDPSTFDAILAKYDASNVIIVETPIETNTRNNIFSIHNPLLDELLFLVRPKKASPDFKPIIRRFKGAGYEFYLATEVSDAFPEGNIISKEKQDGKYLTVDQLTFDGILSKHGANSVIIVEIPIETNSRNNIYPIYNSRGTHCRPVWEEIEDHLYKKIVIQKYCQSHNIYDHVESTSCYSRKPTMYLKRCSTPGFKLGISESPLIPFEKEHTKTEVMEIIKKLVENHCIEEEEIDGIIDKVFEVIPHLNYKQLNDLYYQVILRNILKLCPSFARLKENQGKYKKNHEANLVYKAVEEFYESKYKKCGDCETRRAALQHEVIELKRRERNQMEENRKLREAQKIY